MNTKQFPLLVSAITLVLSLALAGCSLIPMTGSSIMFDSPDTRVPSRVIEVPVDRPLLEKFQGKYRQTLLHYLANSAIWRVTDNNFEKEITSYHHKPKWPDGYVATLRLTPSFFTRDFQQYKGNAVAEFGMLRHGELDTSYSSSSNAKPNSDTRTLEDSGGAAPAMPPNWRIQVMLLVKGDKDPVDKQTDSTKKTAEIKLYTSKWGDGEMTTSELKLRGPEVSIIIFEQAKVPTIAEPYLTKKVLDFVQDELEHVAASADTNPELDEKLLPKFAMQNAPEKGALRRMDISQNGSTGSGAAADGFRFDRNSLTGYLNPGKPGMLELEVEPPVPYRMMEFLFSPGGTKELSRQRTMCGWSSEKGKSYYFSAPYHIRYDEDGDSYRNSCSYKLVFLPADGSGSKVLWSQNGSENKPDSNSAEQKPVVQQEENLYKEGRLDELEKNLEENLKAAQLQEGVQLDTGNDREAERPPTSFTLTMKALRVLGAFYHANLMSEKERGIVLKMRKLDKLTNEQDPDILLKRWQQLIAIDLALGKTKDALAECDSMRQDALSKGSIGKPYVDYVDAIKKEISSLVTSGKSETKENRSVAEDSDVAKILHKRNAAAVLCHVTGWALHKDITLSVGEIKTPQNTYAIEAVVDPIESIKPNIPLKRSMIYFGSKHELLTSGKYAERNQENLKRLAILFAKKQDALLIGSKPADSIAISYDGYEEEYQRRNQGPPVLTPMYYGVEIFPATKENIEAAKALLLRRRTR